MSHSHLNLNQSQFIFFCLFYCSLTFDNVSYFILRRLLNTQSLWVPPNKHIMYLRIPLCFAFVIFLLSTTTNSTEDTKKKCCLCVFGIRPACVILFFHLSIHSRSFRAIDNPLCVIHVSSVCDFLSFAQINNISFRLPSTLV